jgi:hypothetical protein
MILLTILYSLVKSIIYADFISGVGHWLEDRYATLEMKLIANSIVKPNLEHHQTPKSFLTRTYWQRNDITICICICLGAIISIMGCMSITIFLTLMILSQINEVHAMAHQTIQNTPKWVLSLQKLGVLQSKKHHNLHHCRPFENRYCILTNYLNPVLDKIGFFRFLEYLILVVFRTSPN